MGFARPLKVAMILGQVSRFQRARSLRDRITGFGPVDRGSNPRELIFEIVDFIYLISL